MTPKSIFICPLIAFALLSGCAGAEVRNARLTDKINRTPQRSGAGLEKIYSLASGFREDDFSRESLEGYSGKTINSMYDALGNIVFFFPEEQYVRLQEKVLGEKLRRNKPNDYDIEDMYKSYLASRMFEKAAGIKKQFPDIRLPSMPETIISGDSAGSPLWRVYDVADGGRTVTLKTLPLTTGPKAVMLMLPGCSVAENAMADIMADDGLAAIFRRYGAVLTDKFNAESVYLWRAHFNFPEVYLANKAGDFPGFNFHLSPNFYFLYEGKILFQFDGWGGAWGIQKSKEYFRKGLEAISAI